MLNREFIVGYCKHSTAFRGSTPLPYVQVIDGKPAPDIYLVAAKRMGLEPKHCLAFEDALSGLKSAKAAGMFVVSIPDAR